MLVEEDVSGDGDRPSELTENRCVSAPIVQTLSKGVAVTAVRLVTRYGHLL